MERLGFTKPENPWNPIQRIERGWIAIAQAISKLLDMNPIQRIESQQPRSRAQASQCRIQYKELKDSYIYSQDDGVS